MTKAERVKEMRKKAGLSAQKFGDKYGIPLRTIQEWERGGRTAPDYVIDMLEYITEVEKLALTAWVFEEYRDSRGIGSQKMFASKDEAIACAAEHWRTLSAPDEKSYVEDPAGIFGVYLYNVEWDPAAGEFVPTGDALIEAAAWID